MGKNEITVFIDGTMNFFNTVGKVKAEVGSAYLLENLKESLFEYSGVIGISGVYTGNVLFTAPKSMMCELLEQYEGVKFRSELLLDLVGEIANTISGNAREHLGNNFNISVPTVSRGKVGDIKTADGLQTYCVPIAWKGRYANLILALR